MYVFEIERNANVGWKVSKFSMANQMRSFRSHGFVFVPQCMVIILVARTHAFILFGTVANNNNKNVKRKKTKWISYGMLWVETRRTAKHTEKFIHNNKENCVRSTKENRISCTLFSLCRMVFLSLFTIFFSFIFVYKTFFIQSHLENDEEARRSVEIQDKSDWSSQFL